MHIIDTNNNIVTSNMQHPNIKPIVAMWSISVFKLEIKMNTHVFDMHGPHPVRLLHWWLLKTLMK